MKALLLPERCEFTLLHCGAPMTPRRGRTSWEGRPGEGHEITEASYACAAGCGADVSITVREQA